MPFRPKPLPTLASALGVLLLCALGNWQLSRHEQRNVGYRASIARHPLPPLNEEELLRSADPLWRRFELVGHFVGPAHLESGRNNRHRPGYELLQAFQTSGGVRLLVDRGWLPHKGREHLLERLSTHREISLTGQVRPLPQTRIKEVLRVSDTVQTWPPGALTSVYKRMNCTHKMYLIGRLSPPPTREAGVEDFPLSGYTVAVYDKTSLAYAIQWFLMALALIGLWIYGSFERAPKQD